MPNWFKHIDRIGVEIEGAWHPETSEMNARIYGDGSVYDVVCGYDENEFGDYICQSGEICTAPLNSFMSLQTWLDSNFPEHTNQTCGTHLHISTKTIAEYNTVLSKDFYNSFVEMLHRYGDMYRQNVPDEWFTRLEGSNEYCYDVYQPDRQLVDHKPSERYAFLNYCYATHGTFEIRVLPAFDDGDDLLKAVKYIVKWVNAYIGDHLEDEGSEYTYPPIVVDTVLNPTNRKTRQVLSGASAEAYMARQAAAARREIWRRY